MDDFDRDLLLGQARWSVFIQVVEVVRHAVVALRQLLGNNPHAKASAITLHLPWRQSASPLLSFQSRDSCIPKERTTIAHAWTQTINQGQSRWTWGKSGHPCRPPPNDMKARCRTSTNEFAGVTSQVPYRYMQCRCGETRDKEKTGSLAEACVGQHFSSLSSGKDFLPSSTTE